jgi:hypothetical protein
VHIFKTKALARFAKRERISDASLTVAIENAERGLVDADLGGGVIKQRVARLGQGKSGGYRMLIGFRSKRMAVFLFGFAKSALIVVPALGRLITQPRLDHCIENAKAYGLGPLRLVLQPTLIPPIV